MCEQDPKNLYSFNFKTAANFLIPVSFLLLTLLAGRLIPVVGAKVIIGGVVLIALSLYMVISPQVAIALLFVSLFLSPFYREVLPPFFSPFLTLAVFLVGYALIRVLVRGRFSFNERTISFALLIFVLWATCYAFVGYGESPAESLLSIVFPLILYGSFVLLIKSERMVRIPVYGLVVGYVVYAIVFLPNLVTKAWINPDGGYSNMYVDKDTVMTTYTSLHWLYDMGIALTLGFIVHARGARRLMWLLIFFLFASVSLFTFSRGAVLGVATALLAALYMTLIAPTTISSRIVASIESRFQNFRRSKAALSGLFGNDAARSNGLINRRKKIKNLLMFGSLGLGSLVAFYYSPMYRYLSTIKTINMEIYREGRYYLAMEGIKTILHSPFFGIGAGGSPSHSYLLDIPMMYGIPVSILYFYALYRLFGHSHLLAKYSSIALRNPFERSIVTGSFIAFVVVAAECVVDPVLTTHATAIVFWFLRAVEGYYWNLHGAGIQLYDARARSLGRLARRTAPGWKQALRNP